MDRPRKRIRFGLIGLLGGVTLVALILGAWQFLLRPATTVISGRVVLFDGSPAAFVPVTAQAIDPSRSTRFLRESWIHTDRNGEYSTPVMEAGTYNLWADLAGYTCSAIDSIPCRGSTRAPDITLVRGALLRGRVVDADSGAPVTNGGSMGIALMGLSRPESGPAVEAAPLQNDGTFTLRAAPGENYVYLPWTDPHDPVSVRLTVLDGQTMDIELKVPARFHSELEREKQISPATDQPSPTEPQAEQDSK